MSEEMPTEEEFLERYKSKPWWIRLYARALFQLYQIQNGIKTKPKETRYDDLPF